MNTYLLKGDISGIQQYIFHVQSDGAAKSLKGKSVYIDLISKLCYELCKKRLQDEGAKVDEIYCGGGNFFIELKTSNINSVELIQEEINKELLYDEIAIVLTWRLSGHNFGEDWIELLKQSNINKLSKFKNDYQLFTPYSWEQKDKENNKNRFKKYQERYSNNSLFTEITNRLVKSQFIETSLSDENIVLLEENLRERILDKLPVWESYSELESYKKYKNDTDIKADNLIDFDAYGDFAAHRTGTNKLGILKMDVDNLGGIFRDTIKTKEQAKDLSIAFNDFYEVELYRLWNTDLYRSDIYPVFAGGDDCFIIGSWDRIILFAEATHDAFKNYFKEKYTLSAGIIFVHPKHPVSSFAQLVNDALDKAKYYQTFDEAVKEKKHEKNCICLFDEVFSWEELSIIVSYIKPDNDNIIRQIKAGKINRSFIDKIRNSAKGFNALQQQILKSNRIDIPKLWRLKYYIGRKHQSEAFENGLDKFINDYQNALQNALIKRETTYPAIFPVVARIIEMSTKKILEYDTNYDD